MLYKESQMASKGDILLKYKKAYPEFESQSINRLKELKRSFDNEKTAYIHDLNNITNQLKIKILSMINMMKSVMHLIKK